MAKIEIQQQGRSWAIKHDGGFLGYARSRTEAETLAEALRHEPIRFVRTRREAGTGQVRDAEPLPPS